MERPCSSTDRAELRRSLRCGFDSRRGQSSIDNKNESVIMGTSEFHVCPLATERGARSKSRASFYLSGRMEMTKQLAVNNWVIWYKIDHEPPKCIPVTSFEDASNKWLTVLDKNGYGASEVQYLEIRQSDLPGKRIARMSFNGMRFELAEVK